MKAMEMSRKHLLLIKAALNSHINELLDRKDMIERRRYRAGILSEEYELMRRETEAELSETEVLDRIVGDLLLRDARLYGTDNQ